MELQDVILKRKLIEIEVFNENKVYYTGVCLKANNNIWVLVNYDFDENRFNGYTVFKNNDVVNYSVYKKKYTKVNNNELEYFEKMLNLYRINTFYSCLKLSKKFNIIAFFLKNNHKSYFIGKIDVITKNVIVIKVINKKAKSTRDMEIQFSEIDFYSFHSEYEREIEKKIAQ